jgi:hypothetical protein
MEEDQQQGYKVELLLEGPSVLKTLHMNSNPLPNDWKFRKTSMQVCHPPTRMIIIDDT